MIIILLAIFFLQFNVLDVNANSEDDFPLAVDSRIKTFIYTATQIFPVKVNYGYQTFIEFSNSEVIKTIAAGDAVSWSITPSGNRIFIKALEKSGKTNLTVITSKRSYIFDLIARENVQELDRDLTYYVRFYYPEKSDDSNSELDEDSLQASDFLAISNDKRLFNTKYTLIGEKSIHPSEVFDNDKVTFFKFADIIPKIFILKSDNIEYAAKMVIFGEYVVINGVHQNITLRYKDSFAKLINTKKNDR